MLMNISRFLAVTAGAAALALLGGCAVATRGPQPNPVAYRPHNPSAVRVKVSLSKQQVYVMEGDRPLLVAATCVGKAGTLTPAGSFSVIDKIAKKRSSSYGIYRKGDEYYQAKAGEGSGEYKGYPMPFWVEFKSTYGFHQGWVHPAPRTHGCLRLHPNVAANFFALVKVGTPVNIAASQPEDATIGRNVPRPTDYNDPELPLPFLFSDKVFSSSQGAHLQ